MKQIALRALFVALTMCGHLLVIYSGIGFVGETSETVLISLAITATVFWLSTEIVAFLRDKPLFDVYEYLTFKLGPFGVIITMLFQITLVLIFFITAIWSMGIVFPEAFAGEGTSHPAYSGQAIILGLKTVLILSVMNVTFKFPIRLSKAWRQLTQSRMRLHDWLMTAAGVVYGLWVLSVF